MFEDRSYPPFSSLEPFWQSLKCSFAAAPVANAKMAVQRVGMSLKKSVPLPGKVDEQLQLQFYT